jgi:hypothetical protein
MVRRLTWLEAPCIPVQFNSVHFSESWQHEFGSNSFRTSFLPALFFSSKSWTASMNLAAARSALLSKPALFFPSQSLKEASINE